MTILFRPYFVLCGSAFSVLSAETWNTVDYGITPNGEDCTPAVTQMLKKARQCRDSVKIVFPRGTYHFYPDKANIREFYVSNHDQPLMHRIGIDITELRNLTLEGNGAHFVFHGDMMPVLIRNSRGTTCRNFSISYATPFSAEGRIVAMDDKGCTLEFAPEVNPPWKVENGAFIIDGENGAYRPRSAIVFRRDGMIVPTGRGGDIGWAAEATQVDDRRVQFSLNAVPLGCEVGHTVVIRNTTRPHPSMMLDGARNTTLKNVVFHDSQGMAFLAQRSTNIRIDGGGCLCAPGRVHSVSADACHFSNCRGKVVVENATFEGMMDDAINVHATSLRIESITPDRRTLTVRYMHHQAIGFETFRSGENLRFIRAATLENVKNVTKVTKASFINNRLLELRLDTPAPAEIAVGDAVENADWHPSVIFCNNTVRHNRARGALFTTPKPVLAEGNRFINSSGSAILLAGDAAGWYESGACSDVIIRNNLFDHNLTCLYQFTNGIISICPVVSQPEQQAKRYHRNIRIENNTFRTHCVPLLYAISADNVIMRNNTVEYDTLYPTLFEGKPYLIEHCGTMRLQETPTPPAKN